MAKESQGLPGDVVREVKDEEGTKGLEARFLVEAAPDDLLELLWDTARFPELYPDVKEVRILSKGDTAMYIEYRVNAVLKEVRYQVRRAIDRTERVISWKELGGDLRRVRGEWRIEATEDGGSLPTYRAFVDVGYFVPTALVRDIAMRKVGEMIARVRAVASRTT